MSAPIVLGHDGSAEEVGAQLIAGGTVGENPISGNLLGSVVLRLVQRSTIQLLVVPAEDR